MRRHELEKRRRKLCEIRDILASMKTLAAIETHKLGRFIEAQKQIGHAIANIAADFLSFHRDILPAAESLSQVILVIGSERGFCGDFNDRIIKALNQRFSLQARQQAEIIIVGNKLHLLMGNSDDKRTYIRGADIADEIASVLDSLTQALSSYRDIANFYVLHHDQHSSEILTVKLLPPFNEPLPETCAYLTPPLLNMPAEDFLLELTDHYLFNSLHHMLYESLMAENQHRIQHLEHATRRLDDNIEALGRKINGLRQEEIIEEIEVILLNAATD